MRSAEYILNNSLKDKLVQKWKMRIFFLVQSMLKAVSPKSPVVSYYILYQFFYVVINNTGLRFLSFFLPQMNFQLIWVRLWMMNSKTISDFLNLV